MLALTVICIVGFVQLGTSSSYGSFTGGLFSGDIPGTSKLAYGFYQGIFAYSGWNALNFLTEELQNPEKNLPRAVWLSMPIVTVIYLLVNFSYFIVLGAEDIVASEAVAITFAQRRLGSLYWLVPFLVSLSTIGSLNGSILITSRLFFVGARDSMMPDFLALLNYRHKTPIPALIFQCSIVVVYLVIGGRDIENLINFCSFAELACVALSFLGMLLLKWRHPEWIRPVRVPAVLPIVLFLFFTFCLIAPLFGDFKYKVLIGIVILISGAPIHLLVRFVFSKQIEVRIALARLTVFVQKLFLCVPETHVHAGSPSSKTDHQFNPRAMLLYPRSLSLPTEPPSRQRPSPKFGVMLTEDAILEEDEEEEEEEAETHLSSPTSPTTPKAPPQSPVRSVSAGEPYHRHMLNQSDYNRSTSA